MVRVCMCPISATNSNHKQPLFTTAFRLPWLQLSLGIARKSPFIHSHYISKLSVVMNTLIYEYYELRQDKVSTLWTSSELKYNVPQSCQRRINPLFSMNITKGQAITEIRLSFKARNILIRNKQKCIQSANSAVGHAQPYPTYLTHFGQTLSQRLSFESRLLPLFLRKHC